MEREVITKKFNGRSFEIFVPALRNNVASETDPRELWLSTLRPDCYKIVCARLVLSSTDDNQLFTDLFVASSPAMKVDCFVMALRFRLCAIATLLAVLGGPGLSCLVSWQHFSAADTECCQQMAMECGSKQMPASHACCASPSQQAAQPYVAGGSHLQIALATLTASFLPMHGISSVSLFDSAFRFMQLHSPPLALSETNSILRI